MTKKESRRHLSAEQKVAILRDHLVDRVPISNVCEKHQIQPSLFYYWQRQFFENVDDARRVVREFVAHYNGVRLHNAIGYVTPNDVLAGRAEAIWAERDRKLEAACTERARRRAITRREMTAT